MSGELAIDIQSGAYRRVEKSSDYSLERYTVVIRYAYVGGHTCYEEIDVDARDASDAQIIGEMALRRDYEPGGKIHDVIHRQKGWVYF